MPAPVRREDRAVVAPLAFLHGTVHANLLAVPVFLNVAWRLEFQADDVTIGLLAATLFACFGISSVPFGTVTSCSSMVSVTVVEGGAFASVDMSLRSSD